MQGCCSLFSVFPCAQLDLELSIDKGDVLDLQVRHFFVPKQRPTTHVTIAAFAAKLAFDFEPVLQKATIASIGMGSRNGFAVCAAILSAFTCSVRKTFDLVSGGSPFCT